MSFALFLAGGAGLVWLCIEGWHSNAVAAAGVWCALAFAIAALLAAWAMAGHLGWVWVPDPWRNRMEARRWIREWIFGF